MSKIEGPRVGPVGADPVLYEDVAQLTNLKAALDPKAEAAEASAPRPLRDLLWGKAADASTLVSPPPTPTSMNGKPEGKELVLSLRGALERHRAPESEAEGRLLSTLKGLVDAQEGILMRLAKLTKA